MKEYIERRAAIEAFENGEADVIENYGDGCDFGFGLNNIRETLNAVPTEDVEPVTYTEWLEVNGETVCGECRRSLVEIGLYERPPRPLPRCPFCGARRAGGDDGGK